MPDIEFVLISPSLLAYPRFASHRQETVSGQETVSDTNGIKLVCRVIIDQNLPQHGSGFVHEPERFHAPLDDSWLLANKDEKAPQGGGLTGLDGELFDLEALEEVADGLVEPLLPGGGRIYMMGPADGFKEDPEVIRRNRAEEAHRAATPDRLFKERWSSPEQRDLLDETARTMGPIEPAMWADNDDKKVVEMMKPYRERYWGIHARWVEAYEALLAGKVLTDNPYYNPSYSQVHKDILRDAKKIVKEVRETLGDHPMHQVELPRMPDEKAN